MQELTGAVATAAGPPPLPLKRFKAFLEENNVEYTQGGLVFMLQAAGRSLKLCEGGTPLKAMEVMTALDTVVGKPLHVTLMGETMAPPAASAPMSEDAAATVLQRQMRARRIQNTRTMIQRKQ